MQQRTPGFLVWGRSLLVDNVYVRSYYLPSHGVMTDGTRAMSTTIIPAFKHDNAMRDGWFLYTRQRRRRQDRTVVIVGGLRMEFCVYYLCGSCSN